MIEKPKQHEWSERAQGARDFKQMRSLAVEVINSNAATDEQKSAARKALNAIEQALKARATSTAISYAQHRFASLKLAI